MNEKKAKEIRRQVRKGISPDSPVGHTVTLKKHYVEIEGTKVHYEIVEPIRNTVGSFRRIYRDLKRAFKNTTI